MIGLMQICEGICPTEWLSGSGGTGETLHIIAPFLAKRACARAAKPLSDWSRCWAAFPVFDFALKKYKMKRFCSAVFLLIYGKDS